MSRVTLERQSVSVSVSKIDHSVSTQVKYSMGIQLNIALQQTLLGQHVDLLTNTLSYLNDSVLLGEAYPAFLGIGQVQQNEDMTRPFGSKVL